MFVLVLFGFSSGNWRIFKQWLFQLCANMSLIVSIKNSVLLKYLLCDIIDKCAITDIVHFPWFNRPIRNTLTWKPIKICPSISFEADNCKLPKYFNICIYYNHRVQFLTFNISQSVHGSNVWASLFYLKTSNVSFCRFLLQSLQLKPAFDSI